ncbi:Na+/H+ antiporter subunit E [Bacillus andreraoultii]|uniref:Na+/H+ antiporter subunit E n=1 Tax=Bacillus andreraoultii TaxID=1499685 RepID=UPI00053AD972|nr:Na+/H+ antiporter subunit E [Bacillus andreraoultii]
MPIQVLINLFIAGLWMFLQNETSLLTFFSGYFVGLFILFCLRRFFDQPFYPFTIIAIGKLLLIFIYELIVSSFFVMKHVLRPKIHIQPGIFRVETDLKGDLEVTLLSLLICLTPGSVVMEVSPDSKFLYIHALHIPESKQAVLKSKVSFEKAIKDVTRK